jgi:cation transport regulator ChaC
MKTLYFAYGSNMDEAQMAHRCPGAEMTGVGVLHGYRFIINNRGYATLCAESSGTVSGVLWRLAAEHEAALDRYEGVASGLYDKCYRTVNISESDTVLALVYIDHCNRSIGLPKQGYLEKIIAAAGGILEEQMTLLCNWPERRTFGTFNSVVNQIKSGDEVSSRVGRHKNKLVVHLKKNRQELFLRALDAVSENPVWRLEDRLVEMVLHEGEDRAEQYDLELAGRCALESASIDRFKTRITQLRQTDCLVEDLIQVQHVQELAGQGIIVTEDPERPHAPGDRLLVSVNASMLAALWHLLFHDGPITAPRIRTFLSVFAAAAGKHPGQKMSRESVCRLLDEVEALAGERQGELSAEIDAMVQK